VAPLEPLRGGLTVSRKDSVETTESGGLADALLAGFASLDQLQGRIGPLGLPLERRDPGPMWFPLSWPREAEPAGPHCPLFGQVASLEIRFRCDLFQYSPGSSADRLGSRPVGSWLALVTAPRASYEARLAAPARPSEGRDGTDGGEGAVHRRATSAGRSGASS
jgi:hypothetical protein